MCLDKNSFKLLSSDYHKEQISCIFPSLLRIIVLIFVVILMVSSSFSLSKSSQEEDQIKLWRDWLSKHPPEREASELIAVRSIPNIEETDVYIWGVRNINIGEDNLIYASDEKEHFVQIFKLSGKHIGSFGRKGQGPGEFVAPQQIIVQNCGLAIHDGGNRRIQLFDLNRNYKFGFKLYGT